MRSLFITAAFLTALILVCPSNSMANEEHKASITVQLFNQTAKGSPVAGDEITLTIYRQTEQVALFHAIADDAGKYVFSDIPSCNGFFAIAEAKHNNMSFGGHALELIPNQKTFVIQVTVYEFTADTSKLSVPTHHLVIKPRKDAIWITEYIQFNNPLDMAVVSDRTDNNSKNIVLEIKLPNGFQQLSCSRYFIQDALVITEDGFFDTMAIPPGQHKAVFTYSIPIDSETMDITKHISLPTSEMVVFSQSGSAELLGLGTSLGQIKMADGDLADYFQLNSYENGDEITFQVAGLNVKTFNSQAIVIISALFAVAVILVVLVVLRILRRNRSVEKNLNTPSIL